MDRGRNKLRQLAARYFEIANSEQNRRNMALHRSVNDNKGIRPIVLIDEIPWGEMQLEDELTCVCEDEELRWLEANLRMTLYKWKHMRADMVVPPYIGVQKTIRSTGIGMHRRENEHEEHAKSHTYVDQLQTEEDLEKLHFETITYDEADTKRRFAIVADAVGDIVPVKITGEATGYGLGCKTMDDIVMLRGLDNFFYDFIERPEFMHKLIARLTDIFLDKVRQYNELGLFDGDAYYLHATSALTSDLHPDYTHTTSHGVWGRGLAQIFASVSPQMHDEFDIQYMIRAMEPFGLCYYGCCEPLDTKIPILEKIPNLRKISVTPWADVDRATEAIGGRYVVASKPSPAVLAMRTLDEGEVRRELKRIVAACRRNGCSADIVLKDITTVREKPQNLFAWERIAMEVVNE